MTDRGMIFTPGSVLALLAGRKTQSRRPIAGVPMFSAEYDAQWHPHVCPPGGSMPDRWSWWEGPSHGPSLYHSAVLPWHVGDRLWVKEPWRPVHSRDPRRGAKYRADAGRDDTVWRYPRHMPRWASRLTLTVVAVRVQRLQDIHEVDALAEGIEVAPRAALDLVNGGFEPGFFYRDADGRACGGTTGSAVALYREIWSSIHGVRAWARNPWVCALTFAVERRNIAAAPTSEAADA